MDEPSPIISNIQDIILLIDISQSILARAFLCISLYTVQCHCTDIYCDGYPPRSKSTCIYISIPLLYVRPKICSQRFSNQIDNESCLYSHIANSLRAQPFWDNTCDYGDTCTFFISLIIKRRVITTPFGRYVSGWLKIIILRDGENQLLIKFTPNLFFSDGRNTVPGSP